MPEGENKIFAPYKVSARRIRNDWLDEATSRFEDAISAHMQGDSEMQEAMAFYSGEQWGTATPAGWFQDEWDLDEAREVYNLCSPVIRTSVADKMRNVPDPVCMPSNDSRMTWGRARASQKLLRSLLRMGSVFPLDVKQRCETAVDVEGGAFYKTIWDPYAGRMTQGTPEGDVCVQWRDRSSALCDPHGIEEREIFYICDRKRVPVYLLNDRFPKDAFGNSARDRWSVSHDLGALRTRDAIQNDSRSFDPYFNISAEGTHAGNAEDMGELVEYWEKPTNAFPLGRLIVFSGEVVIYAGPIPYNDPQSGEIVWPWIQRLSDNVLPAGLWADGLLRDAIPLQRTINLTASKRREWIDKIMHPALFNPIGAGVDKDEYEDIAGAVIDVTGNKFPEWQNTPDIPTGMFIQEQAGASMIQTTTGFSEISRGEPVQGVESGRHAIILYEQQQAQREPAVKRFEADINRCSGNLLKLIKLYYTEGRVVRQIGTNGRVVARSFMRGDYDLDAEVRIDSFSDLPISRATRQSQATEAFQLGGFEDNEAARRYRRAMGFEADDGDHADSEELHRRRAQDEHLILMNDPLEDVAVLPEDLHAIHIPEHRDYMVTSEFLGQPLMVQQKMRAHLAEHEQEDVADQMSIMQQQQMMEGGPPPEAGAEQGADPLALPPPDGGIGGDTGEGEMAAALGDLEAERGAMFG